MRQITQRIAWAWLFVTLWVLVIMGFASDGFSGSSTFRILTPLLRWLDPDIGWERIREIHFLVRKLAHTFEYAVLAILGFRAFRITLAVPLVYVALLTLGSVLAVAGLDELRQSWLPTRTGSVADIGLDCVGGVLGVIALIVVHRWLGVRSPMTSGGA